MQRFLIIAVALCVFACNEEEPNSSDSTVHLAGVVDMPGGNTGDIGAGACYWKDGVYTPLTNEEINSGVTSLFVHKASVLIGGWKRIVNEISPSVFWVDGQENVIDGTFAKTTLVAARDDRFFGVWFDGTNWVHNMNGGSQPYMDTASNIWPISMALLHDDVYTAGCSYYQSPHFTTDVQHAQYWKNGKLIFRETGYSNALSIFIQGDDIYMAGHVYENDPPKNIACYWKNGQRVELTDGALPSIAKSVYATDEHVYVAGMLDDQAVYWKDGVAIALTMEGAFSMANSIFIHEVDVHVGGYENGYPAYWKNGVRQTIENQDQKGQVKFVVVGEN